MASLATANAAAAFKAPSGSRSRASTAHRMQLVCSAAEGHTAAAAAHSRRSVLLGLAGRLEGAGRGGAWRGGALFAISYQPIACQVQPQASACCEAAYLAVGDSREAAQAAT